MPALDKPGLVVSVAMLGTLTYTVIEAPEHGWRQHSPSWASPRAVLIAGVRRRRAAAEHPMLDVSLFADRRFSAASGAVTVTFFALFGFIFLITQYFQFVRDFGPLSTGARILPVADHRGRFGRRRAPRPAGRHQVVVTGLVLRDGDGWIARVAVDTSYGATIVPKWCSWAWGWA